MEVVEEDINELVDVQESPIRVCTRIKEQFSKNGSLGIVQKCGLQVKRKFSSISDVLAKSATQIARKNGVANEVGKIVNGEAITVCKDKPRTLRAVAMVRDGVEKESQSDEVEIMVSKRAQRTMAEEEDNMTLSHMMKVLISKLKRRVEVNLTVKEKEREQNKEETKEKALKVYTRRDRKDLNVKNVNTITTKKSSLQILQEQEEQNKKEKQKEEACKSEKKGKRQCVSKYGNGEPKRRKKMRNQVGFEIERHMARTNGDLEIMPVEDSDFHDFDRDRKGKSFRKGQVWAVYDDDDGMPRQYALIEKLVSINPFEVNLRWLLFHTESNDETISHTSCGIFKVSKPASIKYLKLFSHPVDCERAARELYRIYPSKGSIWALYRDNGGDNRCYDIVVCLSRYSELYGLSVGYLEKVPGFRTVFKRKEIGANGVIHLGKNDVKLISHQIPAKKLSGAETPGVPKVCWELDPASIAP